MGRSLGVGMASRSTGERHKSIHLLDASRKRGDEAHEDGLAIQCNALRQRIRRPGIIARAGGPEPLVDPHRKATNTSLASTGHTGTNCEAASPAASRSAIALAWRA